MFTGRKEEFIQRVREEASKDDRVRAAWLAGSYGNGTADEYSDIDLHLLIEESFATPVFRSCGAVCRCSTTRGCCRRS